MIDSIAGSLSHITSKWWVFLVRGVAAICVALFAFIHPGAALVSLVLVLGIYLLVVGVLAIAAALAGVGGSHWWALLLEGVIAIIAAPLIWAWPVASALTFVYFIAAWMIVSGIFQIAGGIWLRDFIDNEWLYVLSGIVSIAFGVWVFRSGETGILATAYLIGWYFLFYGIAQAAFAFRIRSLHTAVTPPRVKPA